MRPLGNPERFREIAKPVTQIGGVATSERERIDAMLADCVKSMLRGVPVHHRQIEVDCIVTHQDIVRTQPGLERLQHFVERRGVPQVPCPDPREFRQLARNMLDTYELFEWLAN